MYSKEAGINPGLYPVKGESSSPINLLVKPSLAKCLRFTMWSPINEMLHF